jgi:excinuclease UvrABC nuclease subunit
LFPFEDRASRIKNHQAFYHQLGLSPSHNLRALGASQLFKQRYEESLGRLALFLSGKTRELKRELEKQMMSYAKSEEFEQASKIKGTLFALDHIRDASLIKREELLGVDPTFRIEAFDIAHHGGKSMVGVMVVIENGVPKKRDYRTFHVRGIASSDDPGALTQILERRLRYASWGKPDMVVVDGNKVQYGVAEKMLGGNNISAHIVAVTKGPDHKPKSFVGNEEIIKLYRDQILLANSEAHRFAIGFHRRDARKKLIGK